MARDKLLVDEVGASLRKAKFRKNDAEYLEHDILSVAVVDELEKPEFSALQHRNDRGLSEVQLQNLSKYQAEHKTSRQQERDRKEQRKSFMRDVRVQQESTVPIFGKKRRQNEERATAQAFKVHVQL